MAIKNVEGAELTAVAARSLEKGSEFAAKYGIPKVFGGYDSMAASDEVDAVYIATPHPFHMPCAELFLKAGKHLECDVLPLSESISIIRLMDHVRRQIGIKYPFEGENV